MRFSLVVPFYKFGDKERLEADIEKKYSALKDFLLNDFELIYVSDGIVSNEEKEALGKKDKLLSKFPNLTILENERNMGKGFSVRKGMKIATGDFIGFMDFESEVDTKYIKEALETLEKSDADFLIPDRFNKKSVYKTHFSRKIMSIGYLIFNKILFGFSFPDSQAGFKIFRKESFKKILDKLTIDRFAFDIEIIALAKKEKLKYLQVPIRYVRKSSIKTTTNILTPIKMAIDSIRIRMKC